MTSANSVKLDNHSHQLLSKLERLIYWNIVVLTVVGMKNESRVKKVAIVLVTYLLMIAALVLVSGLVI